MNNTKWDEVRLEMYNISPRPGFSILSTSGYRSKPDWEWYYHFQIGGYKSILHVDILVDSEAGRAVVLAALKRVHVPGEETAEGFRVFGYLEEGQVADYI